MPPLHEDFDDFFDPVDGFANAGTLDGAPVAGILARPYAEGLDVAGEAPFFVLSAEQATAAAVVAGSLLVLEGAGNFRVVAPPAPDGSGLVRLRLRAEA
jgi:hypothetical protein